MGTVVGDDRQKRFVLLVRLSGKLQRLIEVDVGAVALHLPRHTVVHQDRVGVFTFTTDRIGGLADAAATMHQ